MIEFCQQHKTYSEAKLPHFLWRRFEVNVISLKTFPLEKNSTQPVKVLKRGCIRFKNRLKKKCSRDEHTRKREIMDGENH